MKQPIKGGFVYIPFVFPYADEESDSLNPQNEWTKMGNQSGKLHFASNVQESHKSERSTEAPIRPGNRTNWSNTTQVRFSPLLLQTMK